MKMTRKLIPALVMLLVSAIMLSTASFAWFATNDNVKAQDMTVTVKTAASFLEISATEDSGYLHYADASNKKYTGDGLDLVNAQLSGEGNTKRTLAWRTGTSSSATNATTETVYTPVTLAGETYTVANNYALINTFWVRMSAGSTDTISNLAITGVTATIAEGDTNNLSKALRVLVVGPDGIQLWTNTSGTFALDNTSNAMLIDEVDKNAQKLDVYVYFDGDDSTAFTNNTFDANGDRALDDIKVTVTFAAATVAP